MRRSTTDDLLYGDGPFVVQPGSSYADLLNSLGKPTLDGPDAVVKGLKAEAEAFWHRTVYMANIPVDAPFVGALRITHASLNLRFPYRTDTNVVWGVGVHDSVGLFRKSVGALTALTTLEEATTILGQPKSVRRWSAPMIVTEHIWVTDELTYVAEFFTEPHGDSVRSYGTGDQLNLDVLASRHAPEGYIARILGEAAR